MTDPAIPINQQNSFPLLSVAGAQQASDVRVVGGVVVKYWGPAATGISGVPVATDGHGHFAKFGNYLDMTGCSCGAALISRAGSLATLVGKPMQLMFQYRMDKSTTMPTSADDGLGSLQLLMAGINAVNSTTFVFGVTAAQTPQYAMFGWGSSTSAGSGANPSPAIIGSDVRFCISFATNDPGAANLFSLSIWGSSG